MSASRGGGLRGGGSNSGRSCSKASLGGSRCGDGGGRSGGSISFAEGAYGGSGGKNSSVDVYHSKERTPRKSFAGFMELGAATAQEVPAVRVKGVRPKSPLAVAVSLVQAREALYQAVRDVVLAERRILLRL
jgi:hypothetical protein